MNLRAITASLIVLACVGVAAADAGQRGHGRAVVVGRAVPRVAGPRVIGPRVIGISPYRPYYYRPRVGVYYGYPYGYFPYGLSVGFRYGYPYGYGYGYPYGYGYYGYPYAYPYGYPGYVAAVPGHAYGGVRITEAPRDAQVFVDGYYVGIVDDFDGVFQHINLMPGAHRIEIRPNGEPPIAFDVNVQPGQTITYRAR